MKGLAIVLIGVHWQCADRVGDIEDFKGEIDRVVIMMRQAKTALEKDAFNQTLEIDREVYKAKARIILNECAASLESYQRNYFKIMIGEEPDKGEEEHF